MLEKYMTSKDFRLNFQYFILQGFYWMIVCCGISLGSAYLSNRGYSTAAIGILFAVSFVLAALIQPVISVNIDSSSRCSVLDVLFVLGIIISVDLFVACTTSTKEFATGFTFLIGVLFITMVQPFLNSLNFYIEKYGVKMNYGVSRASGSLFFFLLSLIAGNLMKVTSERVLPILGFIVSIGFLITLIWINVELKRTGKSIEKEFDPFDTRQPDGDFSIKSIRKFIDLHRMYFVILVGVVCFFFGHVIINNFIYQITVNVGGDEGNMGGILALAAIIELPAMIFFNRLKEIFSTKILFGVSAFFYLVKMFITAIASSVGMLYFSMLFQALAFALFIPASVHFVNEIMDEKDAVKGQAFLVVAMTIGNALSSLIGGAFIYAFGVTATLWFSTFITLEGVVICIYGLFRINVKK